MRKRTVADEAWTVRPSIEVAEAFELAQNATGLNRSQIINRLRKYLPDVVREIKEEQEKATAAFFAHGGEQGSAGSAPRDRRR